MLNPYAYFFVALCSVLLIGCSSPDQRLGDMAAMGTIQEVEQLLAEGADINSRDDEGKTPLMKAVRNHRVLIYLLDKGADISATDNDGKTALYWANLSNQVESVETLLQRGAEPGDILSSAVLFNHTAIAQALIKHGAQASTVGAYELERAEGPLKELIAKAVASESHKLDADMLKMGIEKSYEAAQQTTWYMPVNVPFGGTHVYPYIGKTDNGTVWLRLKAVMRGDEWVFTKSLRVQVDKTPYTRELSQVKDIDTSVAGRGVTERIDISDVDEIVAAAARGGEVYVSFEGETRRRNYKLTPQDLANFQNIQAIYDRLR